MKLEKAMEDYRLSHLLIQKILMLIGIVNVAVAKLVLLKGML